MNYKKLIVILTNSIGGIIFLCIIFIPIIVLIIIIASTGISNGSSGDTDSTTATATVISQDGLCFFEGYSHTFCLPVACDGSSTPIVTCNFGETGSNWSSGKHTGTDFAASGSPSVVAVAARHRI